MTAPASAIGPAQDALATAFKAKLQLLSGDFTKLKVPVGEPLKQPSKLDAWIDGSVTNWRQSWETTGPATGATMLEEFDLSVFMLAVRATDDLTKPRGDVTTMMQALSDAVRADPTLATTVFEAELAGGVMGPGVIDNFRFVAAQVDVHIRAELGA